MKRTIWAGVAIIIIALVVWGAFTLNDKKSPVESRGTPSSPNSTAVEQKNLVALGSSITKANNLSVSKRGDNEDYSFATGAKIDSFYLYLKSRGENINPIDLASSGASTNDILKKQASNTQSFHPAYITMDPGADILSGISVADYRRNINEIITKINKEGVKVLIATYPNFPSMRSASFSACKENKLGLRLDLLTPERIESLNQAIRDVAAQNNLYLVDLYPVLGPNEVSDYDCLHPNLEGQKKIAQAFIAVFKNLDD